MSTIHSWADGRRRRVALLALAALLATFWLARASGMGLFGLGDDEPARTVMLRDEMAWDDQVPTMRILMRDYASTAFASGLGGTLTDGGQVVEVLHGPTTTPPRRTTPLLPALPTPTPGLPKTPTLGPEGGPELPPELPTLPPVPTPATTGAAGLAFSVGGNGTQGGSTLLSGTLLGSNSLLGVTLSGSGSGGNGYLIDVDATQDGIDVDSNTAIDPLDQVVDDVFPADDGVDTGLGGILDALGAPLN